MHRCTLIDTACRKLTAAAGARIEHYDAIVPQLYLRVAGATERSPDGRKNFGMIYRFAGKQQRLNFGAFPQIGVKAAREAARRALDDLAHGRDPAAPRIAAKLHTFGTVYEKFYRRLERRGASRSYLDGTRTAIGRYVLPVWSERPIASLTKGEVAALVEEISDNGKPSQANHVLAVVKRIVDFAVDQDFGIEVSVAARVKMPSREKKRTRVLDPAELSAIWRLAGTLGYPWGRYLRLLMLTLQRRTEVAQLPWSELSFDGTAWNLPVERSKKNDQPHCVPLSAPAQAILAECPRHSKFVFVTSWSGTGAIAGFSKFKRQLDAALGAAVAPWTLHDLRRTGATMLSKAELGSHQERVIEEILGHVKPGITGVYQLNHYDPEQAQALDSWGRYLISLNA
jgi:integrase